MIEINCINNHENITVEKNTEIDQNLNNNSPYVFINGEKQRVKIPLKMGGQLMMNATYCVRPIGAFTQLIGTVDLADGAASSETVLTKKFGFTSDFKAAFPTKLSILNGINNCNETLFITTGYEYQTLSPPSPTGFDCISENWKISPTQLQQLNQQQNNNTSGTNYIYQSVLVYAFEFLDYGDHMSLVFDTMKNFIPQLEKLNKGLRFHSIGNKLYFFAYLYRNNPTVTNQPKETIDIQTMTEKLKGFLISNS